MAAAWAVAFLSATLVSLLATPLLRRLAVSTGFLDEPAERKSHATPVPYLGGVAIVGAAVVGLVAGAGVAPRVAVIAAAGLGLALTGLLDDRRNLSAFVRLGVQVAAALAVILAGTRIRATDVAAVDILLTTIWIVGITNALNLLDNMDGLAGGTAVVVAAGAFALAALGEQVVVAGLAAAIAGACLGFLAYNVRPASIYMGDAGSTFLGFLLSILVLEVDPALLPPRSFAIPLLLLALPITDTATVSIARTRHGRSVFQGGRDHLSHRLVRRGVPHGGAVAILVGTAALHGVTAVAAGRGAITLPAAAAIVGASLALLLLATVPRLAVYEEPLQPVSGRLKLAALALVIVPIAIAAPGVAAALEARQELSLARAAAERGVNAAEGGDRTAAADAFGSAARRFDAASDALDRPGTDLGLAVPVLASNLRAMRAISAAGEELAGAATDLAGDVDLGALTARGGHVPIDDVRRLGAAIASAAVSLEDAQDELQTSPSSFLLPQVAEARAELLDRATQASRDASRARDVLAVLPDLLGGERPTRWFLAVQNNAELRATGGFIGSFGEIVADRGTLRLERFGRINELNEALPADPSLDVGAEFSERYGRFDVARTWQSVNVTPDLPTAAAVIAQLYPQSGGSEIDGVIAVDPFGLAALLELTGPIDVAPWGEPLTASNVVEVTLRDAYEELPKDARVDFLGRVAEAAWRAALGRDLPGPRQIGNALSEAGRRKHIAVAPVRNEPALTVLDRIGLAGRAPSVGAPGEGGSTSFTLVNQNAAGNKVDWYLQREIDLVVELEPTLPDGPDGAVVVETSTRATMSLRNGAPSAGLDHEVLGPYAPQFAPGENRSFVTVYTPDPFAEARLDGEPVALESSREVGVRAHSGFLSIPPGGERTLSLRLVGSSDLPADGWFGLVVGRQPTVRADDVRVRFVLAPGWRFVDAAGVRLSDERSASAAFEQLEDRLLRVRIERIPTG